MKMTDGLFHQVFDDIKAQYPDIATEHYIIDIGTARLANQPDRFDVIVTPNLYGDIISDVAAEISGSVGLGGSANIGEHIAMFEAIHGSAPDIAGKGIANPSGLLLGAVQMLIHLGQAEVAERIHNAWLRTLEDGIHTADLHSHLSRYHVKTREFTQAVIDRLGQKPQQFKAVSYVNTPQAGISPTSVYVRQPAARKAIVGVDVFVHAADVSADYLAGRMQTLTHQPRPAGFELQMITNRGVKVWPGGFPETFCTDHWRCRFMGVDEQGKPREITHTDIVNLLHNLESDQLDFIKTENLCTFDGKAGYALGQGQ
jgi:isocitrate dehydrogenase